MSKLLTLGVLQQASKLNLLKPPAILEDGNTVAWYDASDLSSITKDGSNIVSAINNKAASDYNLTVGSCLWDDNSFIFDGISQSMNSVGVVTVCTTWMIYAVMKHKSWTLNDTFIASMRNGGGELRQAGSSPGISFYANGSFTGTDYNLELNKYSIVKVLFSGNSSFIQVDQNAKTTGESPTSIFENIALGSRRGIDRFADVEFKEVIIRKISDVDASQTEIYNYLALKHSALQFPIILY